MKLVLAALLLILPAPAPALALSCVAYPAEQAFLDAAASDDRYLVATGVVEFNPADLPQSDEKNPNANTSGTQFSATMTGFSLTGAGFNARFVAPIRVSVQCLGPWCGILQPGASYLTFLKQTEAGYLLETSPCNGFAFFNPDQKTLDSMHACLLGEKCDPNAVNQ